MRAMAKKITWAQAGEIIGLCERQMRRWKERYEEFGYDGFKLRRPVPRVSRTGLLWATPLMAEQCYGNGTRWCCSDRLTRHD